MAKAMPTQVDVVLRPRHPGQDRVVKERSRFNVLMCGRRFGKTSLGHDIAVESSLEGKMVGWMAPSYKILAPAWLDLVTTLLPVPGLVKNELQKIVRLPNGGSIEAWSLDSDDPARSRKFHTIIVDEAGLVPRLAHVFYSALRPTLADFAGGAWFLGTPKGVGDFSKFFSKGQGEGHDPEWASWCLSTGDNPHITEAEIEAMRKDLPHETFLQEVMGIPMASGDHPIGLDRIEACVRPLSKKPVVAWGVDLARAVDFTVAIGLDADAQVAVIERWKAPWGVTRTRLIALLGGTLASVDQTGVGDPIVEDLLRAGVRANGVVFGARNKQHMLESLIAAIQQQRIGFPDGWLRGELESLEASKTQTGTRYAAPSGDHDDGVMALALAWKTMQSVQPHRATSGARAELVDGQSRGYDYAHARPGRTQEEQLQDFLKGAFGGGATSPIAGRYRMPQRRLP